MKKQLEIRSEANEKLTAKLTTHISKFGWNICILKTPAFCILTNSKTRETSFTNQKELLPAVFLLHQNILTVIIYRLSFHRTTFMLQSERQFSAAKKSYRRLIVALH